MAILIKAMEMPKNCAECEISQAYDIRSTWCPLTFTTQAELKRQDNCPLIELPPHGRLIDADAWIAKVREELLSPHSKKGALEIMGAMFRDVLDAPTIIEADSTQFNNFNALDVLESEGEDDSPSY